MKLIGMVCREMAHRWKTSLLACLLIAAVTGMVAFHSVNRAGFQKEMIRNSRDIGSNVVILPAALDQVDYHSNGGYSEVTMSDKVVDQLIEHRASLNHLIPMLERKTKVENGAKNATVRIVGLTASKPVPGRPKSPMQKSIGREKVQLGKSVADQLGVDRDNPGSIMIREKVFAVERVNRSNGTWQDGAILMDLSDMQKLFGLEKQISRIEAIECTSEKCEETGLKSDVILTAELARITDQAALMRKEKMADARLQIRELSRQNTGLIQNALWAILAVSMVAFAWLNINQRQSELGVLQAVGFGSVRVILLFVSRMIALTLVGALTGMTAASLIAYWTSVDLFQSTGKKFAINWNHSMMVVIIALVIAILASLIPALLAAHRDPASLIGKEN